MKAKAGTPAPGGPKRAKRPASDLVAPAVAAVPSVPLNPQAHAAPSSKAWPAGHCRRLRDIWSSAGWPCHDNVELDLLAAGLASRELSAQGHERLRITQAGLAFLASSLAKNRAALNAHEALVAQVAQAMQRAGRLVWQGLSLRSPLPREDGGTRWVMAKPDVFSIRATSVEEYAEPVVHEIKVRRSDLLSDLRRADKALAYQALCSQCWYVLAPGVGQADEIAPAYGVILAHPASTASGPIQLEVLRPAPRRATRLSFGVWMALAKANAQPPLDEGDQGLLGDGDARPFTFGEEDYVRLVEPPQGKSGETTG